MSEQRVSAIVWVLCSGKDEVLLLVTHHVAYHDF